MKKVLILGGGIAGLSAACFLAEKGYQTEIIEASPKLGGRAYSFIDKDSGLIFDNGQHIMMGCYGNTLNFLNLIGASGKIKFQENLSVKFLKSGFQEFSLQSYGNFYPINLLLGLLNFKAITVAGRLSLLKVLIKLPLLSEKDLRKKTVSEWLKDEKQSEENIQCFWDILCIGAMNAEINRASAYLFVRILKEIFLKGNKNTLIVEPETGLSDMYCTDAEKFLYANNGTISKGEAVKKFTISKNKIVSVVTSKRKISDFNFVISTLPFYEIKKLIELDEIPFEYSPILSAHVTLKENNLKKAFYGLINSPVQWIFNKGTHLSIVISSAGELVNKNNDELKEIICKSLYEYAGIKQENICYCKIIKEKRATFIPSNDVIVKRPAAETAYKNLFLAGDWVQTNLPATLEGAVLSAVNAVESLQSVE